MKCKLLRAHKEALFSPGTIALESVYISTVSSSLKGHMSSCTSIAVHTDPYKLATGSQDTNIKLWDLRTKNCVTTLKGHSGAISSVQFAPNNWLASTSEDGTLKIWNITAGKIVGELKCSDLGIAVAKLNPEFYTVVLGCKDKRSMCYDLEQFKLISESLGDTARKIEFDASGKYVFTATDYSLRLSNAENLTILDCKELPGRRLDELMLNKAEKSLYMIATNTFTYSVLKADLNIFNYNSYAYQANQELDVFPTHEKQRSEEPMSDNPQNVIKKQDSKQDVMKFKANIVTTKNEGEPMVDDQPKLNDIQMKESVNLDSFIQVDSGKSFSMISQLLEQHLKIKQTLQRRKSNALTLLSWWEKSNGDLSPTLKALITMNEIATTADFFNFTFAIGLKVDTLSMDNLIDIIPLVGKLIGTKYEAFILTGLKTLEQIYKCHSDKIIQAKKYPSTGGVDIAREERMKKYDQVTSYLLGICSSPQFSLIQSKQGEIGSLSKQMEVNLKYMKKECDNAGSGN